MATYNPYGPVQVDINAAEPAGTTTLEQAAVPVEAGPKASPVRGMSLEQIDAELATLRGQAAPAATPPPTGSPQGAPTRLEQIDAELARLRGPRPSTSPGWDQALGEIRTLPETPHVDVGTEIAPATPAAANPYMPQEAPLEPTTSPPEMALEMFPLGRAARLGEQMVGPAVKRVAPWLAEQAPGVVQRFGQGVGLDLASKAQQLPQLLPSQVTGVPQTTPGQILTPGVPDVLNVVAPEVLHQTLNLPRTVLRYSRAGRALTAADEATHEAMQQYLNELQQYHRAVKTSTEAEGERFVQYQARLQRAHDEAVFKTEQALKAYETKGTQEYQKAADAAKTAHQQYVDEMVAYREAEASQRQGVQQAQALPQRYMPAMPERTIADVRRDMAFLDQGGEPARGVMQSLGVTSPQEASQKLMEEGEHLMQGGAAVTMPSGPEIPSSYQAPAAVDPYKTAMQQWKVPLRAIPSHELELQDFVRQQGGVKVAGEELHGEFQALLSRKESGIAGLQNNTSGKTVQQLAEMAQEHGFIPTADKQALLDALQESIARGRPVYSLYRSTPNPLGEVATRPVRPPVPGGQGSTSRILYDRLEAVAGQAPVDLTPAIEVAGIVKGQLGASMPSMQPSRLERIITDLYDMGSRGSVAQVHQALKDLGPLTRSADGKTRGIAKQLYAGFQQSLELSAAEIPETAGARSLLRQANAAWRQEQAVDEVQRLLTPGGAVLKYDAQGRLILDPRAFLNATERLIARDPFFAGSFSPQQLAALRADVRRLLNTAQIPNQMPLAPDAAPLPGTMSGIAQPAPVTPKVVPPFQPRVDLPDRPGMPGATVPVLGGMRRRASIESITPMMAGLMTGYGRYGAMLSAGLLGADALSYALAKALLTPSLRPLVVDAIRAGRVPPELYSAFVAVAGAAQGAPGAKSTGTE